MNIIIVIGTRPQYIKLKPLHDYLVENKICNYIIDTTQHYTENVSKNFIDELNLNIDCKLDITFDDEISFMSRCISKISEKFREIRSRDGNTVIVMGDTNSTLVASIVAKKMGFQLAHIESGIRCDDKNRPEEMNRILVDELSDIHFVSRERDRENVANPVYIGDLEYNFLNSMSDGDISYGGDILLTIHRKENTIKERLIEIFSYCESLMYPIVFPVHHRTKKVIEDNRIKIPSNIWVMPPLSYNDIISMMRTCRGIISDSGGITKTSPFFGKKCVIPLDKVEWQEVIDKGYGTNKMDLDWFDDYVVRRDKNFYYVPNSCEIIIDKLLSTGG